MRRLYARIYLHLLGVLLVVGLVASVLLGLGQRGAMPRLVVERMTRHISALVAESVGDRPLLARRVAQLHADLEVGVTVWDPAGRVLAAAGSTLAPLSPAELERIRGDALALRSHGPRILAPVRDASGQLAAIVGLAGPPRLRGATPWRPLLALAAVLAGVALAAAPLARRISRPLEALTAAARRLGQGDLAIRVPLAPPSGPGGRRCRRHRPLLEVAELTRAFNDMAVRVERLVGDQKALLANVSHELRSPLARVRVALALVPRDGEGAGRLADVEADLAELERLIDDVLTASRLEATGRPPHPAPLDVRRLLDDLVARARHDPATTGREVRLAGGPVPDLVADATLVKRALWNLVENAGKYGRPPIVLEATREGGHTVLAVTDEGPGIPLGDRDRVLAPFYRADRARTPGDAGEAPRGFGLGLTLAHRIAQVHGGHVAIGPARVADGREHGCRVALVLPAAPPDVPGGGASDAAAPPTTPSTREQRPSGSA
jgi:signal transduction histidine kinase